MKVSKKRWATRVAVLLVVGAGVYLYALAVIHGPHNYGLNYYPPASAILTPTPSPAEVDPATSNTYVAPTSEPTPIPVTPPPQNATPSPACFHWYTPAEKTQAEQSMALGGDSEPICSYEGSGS